MIERVDIYTVYYDGACEPTNPGGHGGFGVAIYKNETLLHTITGYRAPAFDVSNNVMEYSGLISALEWLLERKLQDNQIRFYGDNMMSVRQMNGQWRCKGGFYAPLFDKGRKLVAKFRDIAFTWIPREENGEADELSKAELVKRGVRFRLKPADLPTNQGEKING